MKKSVLFIGILLLGSAIFAQDITGDWYGALDVGVAQLHLVLHIEQKDESYSATMDSPDQGAKGIPVSEITFQNDTLILNINNLQIKYIGKYQPKTHSFDGQFTQMGQRLPLQFSRNKMAAPE